MLSLHALAMLECEHNIITTTTTDGLHLMISLKGGSSLRKGDSLWADGETQVALHYFCLMLLP